MAKWTRHFFQPGLPLGNDGKRVTGSKEHIALARQAATEGMVLLKNENHVLPFAKDTRLALFGKACVDYVKGGGGSGDVTVAYTTSIYDGLVQKEKEGKIRLFHELVGFYQDVIKRQYQNGYEPGMTKEPDLPTQLLQKAADFADVAVVCICRFSGEGWDRKVSLEKNDALWEAELKLAQQQAEVFPNGDFCLTDAEREMICKVKSVFEKIVVVLNVGGVVETAWIREDAAISGALLAWQGGMEGGRAAADLLCGDANPSGKLTDTFAKALEDYPSSANFHDSKDYVEYTDDIYVGYRYFESIPKASEKVIYPFGFGLSYTKFKVCPQELIVDDDKKEIHIPVLVTNEGDRAGKEVVQLYYSAPNGKLLKPAKQLGAFQKTKELAAGETEQITLSLAVSDMASYDDLGKIQTSAWVLEEGDYHFLIGTSVSDIVDWKGCYHQPKDEVISQLCARLVPTHLKERMLGDGSMESLPMGEENSVKNIFARRSNKETEGVVPQERAVERYYLWDDDKKKLLDVAEGKVSLDEFMDQLSIDDMISLLGGQRNHGVSNTGGLGNMPEYGIPEITTADGPAGLRILPEVGICTTAWPCATMLACSFNTELAQQIGNAVAGEVKENNIGIWLAPAVNIHRSPLCGRNFEYYSEDPFVSGQIGAAVVKGVQSRNVAACVKHFAFNNKETNRKNSDSRVSERAAREIYLKAFEIIVKQAEPWCIMTAYNKINGIHCSENKELLQDILRDEWGFDGMVMTDWWTSGEHYLEIIAGNDLKMACGYPERVKAAYEGFEISKGEIRSCAKRVLELILRME